MRGKISHVLTERAWVRGVGIDFLLHACFCWCYVIQPVHHVLHECVVGCPILSSMYGHVPINQIAAWALILNCNHVVERYVIQPVHQVLHECVVGCPILSSTYEHVSSMFRCINHRG